MRLEVIVIDDGSKDATSDDRPRAFADEPRVRLLTLVNGGKARALNQGLTLATGEIVVALDADTQFEPRRSPGWRAGSSIPQSARSPATPRSATASISSPAGRRSNISPRRTSSGARWRGSTR